MQLDAVLDAVRRDLAASEARTLTGAAASHAAVWPTVQAAAVAVLSRVESRRPADPGGSPVRPGERRPGAGTGASLTATERAWLEALVAVAADRALAGLPATVAAAQAEAVRLAVRHAPALQRAALPDSPASSVVLLTAGRFDGQVGRLRDGSPVAAMLTPLADHAARSVADQLDAGLRARLPAPVILQRARGTFGGALIRALRLARSEPRRLHRLVLLTAWQENRATLRGWLWAANLPGSCAACWALHGTAWPLPALLDGHPGCGCLPCPHPRGQEAGALLTPGTVLLPQQSTTLQERVLGAKHQPWARGRLRLLTVVGRRYHPRWGSMRFERSLTQIRQGRHTDPTLHTR